MTFTRHLHQRKSVQASARLPLWAGPCGSFSFAVVPSLTACPPPPSKIFGECQDENGLFHKKEQNVTQKPGRQPGGMCYRTSGKTWRSFFVQRSRETGRFRGIKPLRGFIPRSPRRENVVSAHRADGGKCLFGFQSAFACLRRGRQLKAQRD